MLAIDKNALWLDVDSAHSVFFHKSTFKLVPFGANSALWDFKLSFFPVHSNET